MLNADDDLGSEPLGPTTRAKARPRASSVRSRAHDELLMLMVEPLPDPPDPAAVLARLLRHVPAWHAEAACRGERTADYFKPPSRHYSRVKCHECPVRRECLGVALDDAELVGVWGGSTAAQRWWARAHDLDVDALLVHLDRPRRR